MKKIPSHDALVRAGWKTDAVNAGDLVTVTRAYAGHVSTQRGTKLQQEYFLNEQRQRQAKGLFTVCEVAQYFEDYSFVPDAAEFLNTRLIPAIESKELRVMSESDGFQVRGRSVNVMGDCLRPADVNKWLDKEGASFRWNVDTTPSPAPIVPINGLTGRPFAEALEQPAYQKTPEYQAEYTRANKVWEEIEETENQLAVWERVSAGSVSELDKKEQKTTALNARIVALKASIDHQEPPAPPVVTAGASDGVEPVTGKRWTPEKLAELKSYREKHGTKKAAEHFCISASLIRQKLPSEKPQPKGYSAFTYRTK